MKQLAILFIFSVLLLSCKKDNLTGDKAIFIGKWEWFKSEHTYDICSGNPPEHETITPDNGYRYTMEFLEKGIVKFYENGNKIRKDRIIFKIFRIDECDIPEYYEFFIDLNGDDTDKPENSFDGCISPDTLVLIRGFPYYDDPNGCESYVNYFVKQ